MDILLNTLFFAMWSRLCHWVSHLIVAAKEKVSLLVKFISPTVKQELSACPSMVGSFNRPQMAQPSFLANLFKPLGETPSLDVERGPDIPTEDAMVRRFSRPKKWIDARVEQKRESCTTIPSFFVAEASKSDDEWHVRYRRDVLGIVSPPILAASRLESAISSIACDTTPEEHSPLSYTDEDRSDCSLNYDEISDEIITPSASFDSPLVTQIFTPRISNTPTIDNLAMGLHTPFIPDGTKRPLPIDTDPYDLMLHLFGDEFTRMDQACIAKLLSTNEIFSIPTASVGLAIELALSNENVIADIPWGPLRSTLRVDGLPRLRVLRKSSYMQEGSHPRIEGDITINASTPSPEEMSASHVSFMNDSADFIVTDEPEDPSVATSGLIPANEGATAVEIHDPGSATLPDTVVYIAQSPYLPEVFDEDTLLDLPVFLAMSELTWSCGLTGNVSDDAASPLVEAIDVFSSPSTRTSHSTPDLATPVQITDIDTSPSVYSCCTLDSDTQAVRITDDDDKDNTRTIKLDEQPLSQALCEDEDLEYDPNVTIRYKRQGIFIPAPPPPAPSRLTRTPSVPQTVSMIPFRGVNIKSTHLPIKRHASKLGLTGFVTSVVQAASLYPSRSRESFRGLTTTPCVQLALETQDPFTHLNWPSHVDQHCAFKSDINNLDIYQIPAAKSPPQSPQPFEYNASPAIGTHRQELKFTDLIPTYLYDYSALNPKAKSSTTTPKHMSRRPLKSFLVDNSYGCPSQNTKTITNTLGSRFQSTFPKHLPDQTLPTPDMYRYVSRSSKRQNGKHCKKTRLATIAEHLDGNGDDLSTTDRSSICFAASVVCVSASDPSVVPHDTVTCPLISISPPSISSIFLDDSLSVSASDSSNSAMRPFGSGLLSVCTPSVPRASMCPMSSRHVPDQTLRNEANITEPVNLFVTPHKKAPQHKRQNFTVTCPDDMASSRRTLENMRVNHPPLPRLLPPAPVSGVNESSIGLPALEDILVVNENYVSGLALPSGSPTRRVSAPSTCPFVAAAAAAARTAALGEIRYSGSNVPASFPLTSRRQSFVHANREPRVWNKTHKRPLRPIAKSGNRTSNLKPLVLPMKLALREANEVNMRLSSKLEALGTPNLSFESTSPNMSIDSKNLGSNASASSAIAAIIELLDAANVPQSTVPPRLSNSSNNSSQRISPEWGVAF